MKLDVRGNSIVYKDKINIDRENFEWIENNRYTEVIIYHAY